MYSYYSFHFLNYSLFLLNLSNGRPRHRRASRGLSRYILFFSKNYKKYYWISQRVAHAIGVPQEASLESSRILTKYSLKSKIGFWVHNFLFSKYSKVFYKFLKKLSYVLNLFLKVFELFLVSIESLKGSPIP